MIFIHPQNYHFTMAKKAKKIKTAKGLKLDVVNPNAAGIDVSSKEMQVMCTRRQRWRQQSLFWCFHRRLEIN